MTKPVFTIIAPQFQHDCALCRFIGIHDGYDCYTCGDSIIMRDGDSGPEYQSLPRDIAAQVAPYRDVLAMEQAIINSGGFAT